MSLLLFTCAEMGLTTRFGCCFSFVWWFSTFLHTCSWLLWFWGQSNRLSFSIVPKGSHFALALFRTQSFVSLQFNMYELSLVASCVFLWLLDYRVIQMVQWVEGVWIVLWQCLVVSCSWNATYASTAYKLGFNQLEIWSIILLSFCRPTFLIFHTFDILVCSPILGFGVLSVKFIFFLQIMILDFFFWDFATPPASSHSTHSCLYLCL